MWWIIASLVLLGILFMFIEMLLVPGVGVAGILSLASFVSSCWYAFTFCSRKAGFITMAVVLILMVIFLVVILRAKTWKKWELKTEIDSKVNEEPSALQPGQRGEALTRLAPMGTGRFGDCTCEVKSYDNTMISAGTAIEVVGISDNKVMVKAL